MTNDRLQAAEQALPPLKHLPSVPLGRYAAMVEGALAGLRRGDWWVPGPRERAGGVLRGVEADRLLETGSRPYRIGPVLEAGPRAGFAVGLALAEPDRVTLVHLGWAAIGDGDVAEALHLAVATRAPLLLLFALPTFPPGAPLARPALEPAAWLRGFGLASAEVDGRDAAAVQAAVQANRPQGGPCALLASLA